MASGATSAVQLTRDYLERIEAVDWSGPINSIIEVNPDAETIAAQLDAERAVGQARGPMHGIPIVLKDCVATVDRMETTGGTFALVGSKVPRDAGVVTKLREAGAILFGKANLSEWNAFRGWPTHGGWSGQGRDGPQSLRARVSVPVIRAQVRQRPSRRTLRWARWGWKPTVRS